jgi:hypothetical protein
MNTTKDKSSIQDKIIFEIIESKITSPHDSKDTLVFEDLADNDIIYDDENGIYLGDCFLLDSGEFNYGFILYEMTTSSYAMVPAKLDTNKVGIQMFKFGSVRMTGGGKYKYPESMHVWSEEEKIEFLEGFVKVGNLPLKKNRPAVKSYCTMLKYNLDEFEHFIWFQDNTYDDAMKIYPTLEKLIDN